MLTRSLTGHQSNSAQPLIDPTSSTFAEYSTTVIRAHPQQHTDTVPPSLSSILTIRPAPSLNGTDDLTDHPLAIGPHGPTPNESIISIETYHTASESTSSAMTPSIAAATEGSSSIRSSILPLVHRFTLLKPGVKRAAGPPPGDRSRSTSPVRTSSESLWNPLEFIFSSALLGAKCDVCFKRLGWKPVLECDDCGLRSVSLAFLDLLNRTYIDFSQRTYQMW